MRILSKFLFKNDLFLFSRSFIDRLEHIGFVKTVPWHGPMEDFVPLISLNLNTLLSINSLFVRECKTYSQE